MLDKNDLKIKVLGGRKEDVVALIKKDLDLDERRKRRLITSVYSKYESFVNDIYKEYIELYNGNEIDGLSKRDKYFYLFRERLFEFQRVDHKYADNEVLPGIIRFDNVEDLLKSYEGSGYRYIKYKCIAGNAYCSSEELFEDIWYNFFGKDKGLIKKTVFQSGLITLTEMLICVGKLELPLIQLKQISGNKTIKKRINKLSDLIVDIKKVDELVEFVKKVNEANNFEELQDILKQEYNLIVYYEPNRLVGAPAYYDRAIKLIDN